MKRCLIVLIVAMLIMVQGVALASDIVPTIPIAEQLSTASISGTVYEEESGIACIEYSPADSNDLDYLFTLCAACGTFSIQIPNSSGRQEQNYMLLVPGTDYTAYAAYDSQESYVRLFFPDSASVVDGDNLEKLLDTLCVTPRLPSGSGKNVLPQFYACVERQPVWTGLQGEISYVFDDQMCWTEIYDEVDDVKLSKYTIKMLQFGCSVGCETFSTDDAGRYDPCVLHFSNGDAEVIVSYSARDQRATVYYKPGISYNLLDARQLAEAFN